jgi:DNA-binding NtrC family response regulator
MTVNDTAKSNAFDLLIVTNRQGDRDWVHERVEQASDWKSLWVRTEYEMLDVLRQSRVPVVICRTELPDSTWKHVLITLQEFHVPPSVIVLSDGEDIDLWTEVLNHGGFDTIHRGVSREPVLHTVRQAFRRWKRKEEILMARKKNPGAEGSSHVAGTA